MNETLEIGDLVLIISYHYSSPWNNSLGIVIGKPNVYNVYPVFMQNGLVKRNFTFGELEKLA